MAPTNIRSRELASLLCSTFRVLGNAEITYCVLRNYEQLPDYTTHDVDILVRSGELEKAVLGIKENIRKCGWTNIAVVRQMGSCSLYCMLESDGVVQCMTFDVVEDLPWAWMPTCDVDYVLSNSIEHNGIPVACKGTEAALRLIKELLRGTVPKEYACKMICSGANSDPENFIRCFSGRLSETVSQELLNSARSCKIEQLVEKRKYFQRSLIRTVHSPGFIAMFSRFIRYYISRYKRFSSGSLGLFVVLLGPDGAGKTSLSDRLADRLGQLLFKGTSRYHMQFNMIPKLSNVLYKLFRFQTEQIDFTRKHSGSSIAPHLPWRSFLYVCYYSLDFLFGRLRLRKEKGLGCLILFDRYFYDFYFQRCNRRLSTRILDVFRYMVPKPDLVLLLESDPETIYARKDELELDEIRIQLDRAARVGRELARIVPVRNVRTDCGIDSALDEAECAVFEALVLKNGKMAV